MVGDRVAELADGDLPLGLRVVEVVRQGQRAPQAVVDARASGQQRVGFGSGVASGPGDLAARQLQIEHEVDGLGDDRPHVLGEPSIAGDQHVVPDTGRDVGAEVAVAVGVLDDAVAQLDRPRAVGPLGRPAPLERGACGFQQTRPRSAPSRSRRGPTGRCGRRRTTEWRPRTPVWRRSTARSGGTAPGSGRQARPERQDAATDTAGFWKYSATLLPISGFSSDSAVRVSHGRLTMSHTSSLW